VNNDTKGNNMDLTYLLEVTGLLDDRQREIIETLIALGSTRKAAKELGVNPSVVSRTVSRAQKRASRFGHAPGHWNGGVAPGYHMGKVTVARDCETNEPKTAWERQHPDGNPISDEIPEGLLADKITILRSDMGVTQRWDTYKPDKADILRSIRDAAEAMSENIDRADAVVAPSVVNSDLCNLYTFTDYHLGEMAWHREGGADWDIKIAENMIMAAMRSMVNQSPQAHTAVINIQGDFLHTDGKLPLTPASKHVLDADSRYPKIRKAAIRIIRGLVQFAAERHQEIHLIIAEGNHDEEGSGWLADCFCVHYENDPRISVNDSALPFYVFEWGQTMLGVHHGHKVKNENLPLLFAAQFPEIWGRTKRREVHCGHRHHRDEKEYNGVTVVQHPTLAARDAYAARGGWIADRSAQAITYHKKFGQVGRVSVCPEMLV